MDWIVIYSVVWVVVSLVLLRINLHYKKKAVKEYDAAVNLKTNAAAEYRKAAQTMESAVEVLAVATAAVMNVQKKDKNSTG